MGDDYDDEGDITDLSDEFEQALANCCGSFGRDGVFRCGAVGSEDCEFECPFNRDIGYTAEEIEKREGDDIQPRGKE